MVSLSNLNGTDSRVTNHNFSFSYVLCLITSLPWYLFSCKIHLAPSPHPRICSPLYTYIWTYIYHYFITIFVSSSMPSALWRQEQWLPHVCFCGMEHSVYMLINNCGWINGLVNLTNIYWVQLGRKIFSSTLLLAGLIVKMTGDRLRGEKAI